MNNQLPDLNTLKNRIKATKLEVAHGEQPSEKGAGKQAIRMGADLTAGVVVGMVGGYFLDDWLGSKPTFMFLGLAVGFIAGIRLMTHGLKQAEREEALRAEIERLKKD